MTTKKQPAIFIIFLALIVIVGFFVRLYRFNNPIADWHSWRQADTSAVSRNFAMNGFDVLHPTFEDISNVPSGIDNPHGYRFVEFPIYNVAQAGLFKLFGIVTLEESGRLVTIIASLFSVVLIYFLLSKYTNKTVGILSAFFYSFLPYSIYYGRVILPDTLMVTTTLAGIYFFDRCLEESIKPKRMSITYWVWFVLATIFTASALLLKPFAIFFFLPMLYIALHYYGISFLKKWQLYVFAILSVMPLILWRIWITRYPEGIPASAWLFNEGGIRFRPAFFRWIFYERLTKLILGISGLVFFALGIFSLWNQIITKKKLKNAPWFFISFLIASMFYVIIVARGNVQHDYYQIPTIPSIAMILGLGGAYLLEWGKRFKNIYLPFILLVLVIVSTIGGGWFYVKDYFNINNSAIVTAGQAVDKLTPKNAKIVAPYDGDTSFLYQTKRQGWPSFEKPLSQLIAMGADYLVLVNPQPKDYDIGKTYKIVSATPQYILFNLRQKP